MNERIKELAEQARSWAETAYKQQNDQFTSHWDTPIGYTPSQFFEQKFAELIVKECMAIGFHTVYKVDDDSAAVAVYQNIKEHFGVEE
jgi:hypothetical protein